MKRFIRRCLQRISARLRPDTPGRQDKMPDGRAAEAARQRHMLRIRDETLARVTFGQG